MPANKDLKRLVRARMHKTGEAYTTARAQLEKKPKTVRTAARAARATSAPRDYATLAGMSDDVVKAKTGCDWNRWVTTLDYHGAETMSHREIAELVKTKYKVADWWTQMVTVGYERIRGLRWRYSMPNCPTRRPRSGSSNIGRSGSTLSVSSLAASRISWSLRAGRRNETGMTFLG